MTEHHGFETPILSTQPATFGGPGFERRRKSHAEDVAAGCDWVRCGYDRETDPLREVIVHWPGPETQFEDSPDRHLYLRHVALEELQQQCRAIIAFFESQGVRVNVHRPRQALPPSKSNLLFFRDLFVATREGVVLGRMASQQRAGEEPFASSALAAIGLPIVASPRGSATLEGADVLFLGPRLVLVGVGNRTNRAGYEFVASVMRSMGIETIAVPMPGAVQHLLGALNFVARDLAVVLGVERMSRTLDILEEHYVRAIVVEPSAEISAGRAMNFVTLAPRKVVMPAGCPDFARRLRAEGVLCHELDVSEYVGAGGGLGCLTGVVRRDWSPPTRITDSSDEP